MARHRAKQRRSIRLPQFDYTQPGAYTVTICTRPQAPMLGQIIGGVVRLNDYGKVVEDCWRQIPSHNSMVELDVFAVMPNHLHGILVLRQNAPSRGTACRAPTKTFGQPVSGSTRWLGKMSPLLHQQKGRQPHPHGICGFYDASAAARTRVDG